MSKKTASCKSHGHIYGFSRKCVFCGFPEGDTKSGLTREKVVGMAELSVSVDALRAEITALREELAKCREEGRRQWRLAHGDRCLEDACRIGEHTNCFWPMPKILEGE